MTNFVLKKMAQIHCARGPSRCEICKNYAKKKKWALLELSPSEHLEATRPVIEIEGGEEKIFLPFDVLAYFDSLREAINEAKKRGLEFNIIKQK
ncbi:MAG: hypothetical protein FK734_20115 [Asgard group archaeon]|nr:hypothetical protein [Asgard group archaeon]